MIGTTLTIYGYTISAEFAFAITVAFFALMLLVGLISLDLYFELKAYKEREQLYEDTYCDTD